MSTLAGAANPPNQAPVALGLGSMSPAPTSPLIGGSTAQHAHVTQQGSPNQASMTWPPKYEKDDSIAFLPASGRAPTQHALSEAEQQGWASGDSPAGQISSVLQAANPSELTAMSAQNPRGGHHSQHTLSEQEQQGSLVTAAQTVQGSTAQPLPIKRGPSPQELELVASQQVPGGALATRRSPTHDLTELEQQGSFTVTPEPMQSQVGNQDGAEAAELARDLARRKGAQAELERQYSQLQLQHQQVSPPSHHPSGCLSMSVRQSLYRTTACQLLSQSLLCLSVCLSHCLFVCHRLFSCLSAYPWLCKVLT